MSARIEDLLPEAQEKYHLLADWLTKNEIKFSLVYTLRTAEEQHDLWLKGRDSSGNIVDQSLVVTNCDGYNKLSNHQSGRAFDLTFADDNGNPIWPDDPVRWFALGTQAESFGLAWGGRFQPLDHNGLGWDPDHFEVEV